MKTKVKLPTHATIIIDATVNPRMRMITFASPQRDKFSNIQWSRILVKLNKSNIWLHDDYKIFERDEDFGTKARNTWYTFGIKDGDLGVCATILGHQDGPDAIEDHLCDLQNYSVCSWMMRLETSITDDWGGGLNLEHVGNLHIRLTNGIDVRGIECKVTGKA